MVNILILAQLFEVKLTCAKMLVKARPAAFCTRVREIRRICKSSGCTLHTCSRNTTISELKRLYLPHLFEKYKEFVARPKRLALCESTPPALWVQSCSKVTFCQLQLCIKQTAPQTRVPAIQNVDLSGLLAGCTLRMCSKNTTNSTSGCCTFHTCSRNTTNSEIQRLHFAHVFEKYDEFANLAAVLCTLVREIRRIRSSSGCT